MTRFSGHTLEPGLLDTLVQLVGAEHVATDAPTLRAMSEDIHARGALAGVVVAPGSVDEVSRVVSAATQAGLAVVPRGGGMSYTSGYLPESAGALVLDLRRLNRIVSVDPARMTVTVEAGATWEGLRAALRPHGLRTPFWGPLSGLASTIGGGISQQNAFFGTGVWGPTSDSLTSVAVVLADGSIIRTGSGGAGHGAPFFRHDGPDLTGLFCGDCGALGIKVEATFRLIPEPGHEDWLSFALPGLGATARAAAEVARSGLACEVCAFDPTLASMRMRRASLLSDVKTLAAVAGASKTMLGGLAEAAKIAIAGRGFMDGAGHTLHLVTEGHSAAGVADAARALRAIVTGCGGREIENTIPKAMRAEPFPPLNSVLGPDGQRWAPIHGIVALDQAEACWTGIEAAFSARRAQFAHLGIETGYLVTTLATNGFLIEPVFYWHDERFAIHEAIMDPGLLRRMPSHRASPEGAAAVREAREAVLDVFEAHGAAHFQIGRAYRWAKTRSPDTLALIRAFKAIVDPKGLINPGALGL